MLCSMVIKGLEDALEDFLCFLPRTLLSSGDNALNWDGLPLDTCILCQVFGFESWLHSLFQLLTNEKPGKLQVMAQIFEFLPLTWKTRMEFHSPGIGLACFYMLWVFG